MCLIVPNACIERCAYPELNGDESSIFCVSLQVAQNLATTFLRTTCRNLRAGYPLQYATWRPSETAMKLKTRKIRTSRMDSNKCE